MRVPPGRGTAERRATYITLLFFLPITSRRLYDPTHRDENGGTSHDSPSLGTSITPAHCAPHSRACTPPAPHAPTHPEPDGIHSPPTRRGTTPAPPPRKPLTVQPRLHLPGPNSVHYRTPQHMIGPRATTSSTRNKYPDPSRTPAPQRSNSPVPTPPLHVH